MASSSALSNIVSKTFTVTLARFGCVNRPFYQIVCIHARHRKHEQDIIEKLGCFDPIPNDHNEKVISLNFDRVKYWLAKENVTFSVSVLELLGLCGFLPVHPKTFANARKFRSEIDRVNKQIDEYKSQKFRLSEEEAAIDDSKKIVAETSTTTSSA